MSVEYSMNLQIKNPTRWDILSFEYGISVTTLIRLNPKYLEYWELEPGMEVTIPETENLTLSRTSRNLIESKGLYPYE